MTANDLRTKFITFFEGKGHRQVPSSSLVPENDPTALFTSAGMQPLTQYLLGEKHHAGDKLVNFQKCIRTGDIEEVGDESHLTFFEMMGYWSLGSYWKKEAIEYTFEFFTKELGIDIKNLAVTCFEGESENNIPKDEESAEIWKSLGVPENRIAFLGREDNFWGPVGETGPCGPDTEVFVWTGDGEVPEKFEPTDKKWMEIGNDVFMGFNRKQKTPLRQGYEGQAENSGTVYEYEELAQKNVDFGAGFERIASYLEGKSNVYETELFEPILDEIEKISGSVIPAKAGIQEDNTGSQIKSGMTAKRIIADHIKAAVFMIDDGITPSNKDRGYVLRRLIRRAIVKAKQLGIEENFTAKVAEKVFEIYSGVYFNAANDVISTDLSAEALAEEGAEKSYDRSLDTTRRVPFGARDDILNELEKEEAKFRNTLKDGLRVLESKKTVSGKDLFDLYQSFGIPSEISLEEIDRLKNTLEPNAVSDFEELYRQHQDLSRTASAGMFRGGLAEAGEITTKFHTATHLMLAALREVLGDGVFQKGSNITPERIRFDFSYPEKLTDEEIKKVEDIVNEKIEADLPVTMEEMTVEEAKQSGAMGVFESKYGERVKVYSIGDYSSEICGGPHTIHTGELGKFKILKEESSSSGVRRIKAVLE